ncbi:MAG: hypothetical protein K0S71_838 [Clostridia bacterium]|jgi:hypothetical protein|nr:hypothetical protein [Clostridia bacterium]
MFKSQRLSFRKLGKPDFDFFYQIFSDEKVMKYTYLDRFKSIKEAEAAFQKVLSMQEDNDAGTQYIVSLNEENIPIGIVDYEILLKNQFGGIVNKKSFAVIGLRRKQRHVMIEFYSEYGINSSRIAKVHIKEEKRIVNRINITVIDEIDDELIEWLLSSYHIVSGEAD